MDILEGGLDADVIYSGADVFRYRIDNAGELATLGGDTINGFKSGEDMIELTDLIVDFGINPDNAFIGIIQLGELLSGFGVCSIEDAFNGGYLLLTKNGADTLVQLDKDGSGGGAAAVTVATVVGATIMETDFQYGSV